MDCERDLGERGSEMKIVAFLQNVWVKDPDRLRAIFHREPEIREPMIAKLLFMGSLTGRRLKAAFGDLCDEIVWEETTERISGDPTEIFPADRVHMVRVLRKHEPGVVIAFGRIAQEALREIFLNWPKEEFTKARIYHSPHPAARQVGTPAKLAEIAASTRKALCQ